ncbi:DoxX family protein [Dactylosporangium matsuzakiense]|uniref:DoxX family protein n=1 Tax=Dactylosporangium matsuzakiense TaxID=53360 RepID=UPI0021C4C1ED|nr:DoxX family protein [Dactylosporangium matsuzakiense]
MRPVRTAARSMLAAIFVIQGWSSFSNPARLAGKAVRVTEKLEPTIKAMHPSLPTEAETLVRVNGAVQVAGGLLLASGHATRPAALALAGSLVPTTLAGHAFWEIEDPAERAQQRIQFLKNIGLFGGLLLAALDREGRPDLRWRAGHAARSSARTLKRARRHLRDSSPIPLHHR